MTKCRWSKCINRIKLQILFNVNLKRTIILAKFPVIFKRIKEKCLMNLIEFENMQVKILIYNKSLYKLVAWYHNG